MMNTAQRIECTELYPAGIKFRKGVIVFDVSAIPRNVTGSKRNHSQPCGKNHRNLISQLPPTLQYIVSISAISRPTERITLQSRISGTSHLEDATVRIPFLELLFDHFIPSQSVDIMDFVVHPQVMFHHKAFGLLFVAPCGFSHIRPEAGDTVVNGFLLIGSPPVGYGRQGKIHYPTVSTPRPRHIITLPVRAVLDKISQTVRFLPLLLVGLRDDRVLRYDYLESHFFQVGKHLFRVLVVSFPPFEVL